MTIGEFCGNFGNFEENRPLQAVEICVFTLFSRLPGVASPFAIPKIYILNENRVFSLVLYLKLRHFHTQGIRRTLTSATGASLSHRFGTCIFDKSACRQAAIMGRELFAFICVGQSKASGR